MGMNHLENHDVLLERMAGLEVKVNKCLVVLEGSGEDAPGLMARLSLLERVLFGKERQDEGIVYKVGVLWRINVWVMCTMSAAAGFLLRELVRVIWKV